MNRKTGLLLYLSLLAVVFMVAPVWAEPQPELMDIQFSGKSATSEKVILKLNGSYIPNAFTLKDETPRIVLDFPNVRHGLKVKQMTDTNAALVKRIRVGMHTGNELKTRVVFDMTTLEGVSFKQDFDDKTNTITITFSRSTEEVSAEKKGLTPQKNRQKPSASQPATSAAGQTEEKPATPPEMGAQPKAAISVTAEDKPKPVADDSAAAPDQKSRPAPGEADTTQPAGEQQLNKKESQDAKTQKDEASAESTPVTKTEAKPAPDSETVAAAGTAASQKASNEQASKDAKEMPAKDTPAAGGNGKENAPKPGTSADSKNEIKPEAAAAKVVNAGAMIGSITFDGKSPKGEMVLFKLNDFHPPTIHGVEEGTPRVICDFDKAQLAESVKSLIKTDGKFVKVIRVAKHKKPERVRVVIDLEPKLSYDLQQVFFKEDNLFVIIVNTMKK